MKFSCNLLVIAVGSMLFSSTRARVAAPQAVDLIPRSGNLDTRTGDCIEVHVYIREESPTAYGDCATFQLWRNGVQVGAEEQCQNLGSAGGTFDVGFSDGTTASTSGTGEWISVSGVSSNLNLVARNARGSDSAVSVSEYELAGNTANHDAAGCTGYSNARLCDFQPVC
ncbi:hypothetical protein BS47DRAFT_1339846 [Hydnum rufescens UP504]|uniref:Uncharacterized protein n=1 Tax=Hydnum rufescens UP504 TaxID=1448309 RepID=A0A9P6B4U7_9AGAM|nr:hypothetical protein BS47DRAFT_1339846 [Hydnum rufescens UP504]